MHWRKLEKNLNWSPCVKIEYMSFIHYTVCDTSSNHHSENKINRIRMVFEE